MDDPPPIPKLLRYLFGQAAGAAHHAASPRLLLWCEAFDGWLAERGRKYRRAAVKLAERSWQRLLARQGKLPWELALADFEAHAAWMLAQGYSANYTSQELGALAGFYRWCEAHQVDPECPLSFNPAAGVRRPQSHPFEGASLLSRAEMERLLGYIQRDSSPLGRREYAFFLARLSLGVPLYSLQQLTWGQIDSKGGEGVAITGAAWVRWRADSEPFRLPEQVWEAIRLWLSASGRLPGMRLGDYIFTPLVDPLQREPSDRAAAWASERCLSIALIEDNLRLYGLRLGIAKQKLTPLALRRTALCLRVDCGDTPEQMRAFMDSRGRLRDTLRLMSRLPPLPPDPLPRTQEPERPQAAPQPDEAPLPPRKFTPFPSGAALQHGLFAQSQPAEQVLEILAEDVRGVEAELTGLRLLSRGLIALQARARNSRELSQLAQAYTLTAQRLATMIASEKRLQQDSQQDDWVEEALAALDRIAESFGEPPWSPDIRAEACSGDPDLAAGSRGLDEEIAAMRLVLRKTLALASETEQQCQVGQYIHLVDVYSQGCNRLMQLLLAGQAGQGRLEAYLRQLFDTALDDVRKEMTLE